MFGKLCKYHRRLLATCWKPVLEQYHTQGPWTCVNHHSRKTARSLPPASRRLHTSTPPHASSWDPNYPLDDLQKLFADPASSWISPDQRLFSPSLAEIELGQGLFLPKTGKKVQSVKGVVDLRDLPESHLPEVCFMGRSNVGKSSLIKALFFGTEDVKKISVSRKPGHTRTLQFFSIQKRFTLVDMPGYGHNMPEHFTESVESYLQTRNNLQRAFLLLDASVGISATDQIGIELMEEVGRPYTIVFTKIDKNSHHKVLLKLQETENYRQEKMPLCFPQFFLASSQTGAGLSLLRTFISYSTGNLAVKGH